MDGKAFFLFPGQGAQYPGMALDLLEHGGGKIKELFSLASEINGKDMAALLAGSSAEDLKRTDISQPAITLANLSAAAYLGEKGILPSGCAGFSLGEYAALALAGIITNEECFFLVKQRGMAMQNAVDSIKSNDADVPGMAAVAGLPPEKVEALINEWKADPSSELKNLYAANINSPKQTAVSGTAKALSEAESLFLGAGAKRYIRLQVNCPFHSPLLSGAAEEFTPFLEKINFKDPVLPFFANFTGKQVFTGGEAKKNSIAQITGAVRWIDEEKAVAKLNPPFVLETGPGKVLQGLWKDAENSIPCFGAGTVADINKILEERK